MDAKEYLINHSLKEDFVLSRGWELGEKFITIPIFDAEGKFVFNKYRQFEGDSKFTADSGSHPMLYGVEHIKNKDEVVLCEGEPDCVRLWQEGITAVTGTFGVTTFNEKLAKPLSGKKVYVTVDTDEPGQKEITKYCEELIKVGATPLIVSLPKEFKDVSEYFTAGNTKEDFNILKIMAVTPEQWEEDHQPEEWKLESGKDLMARELPPEEWLIDRVIPSEGFTFIVGAEATGKSFYTLTLAHSVATGQPWLGQFKVGKKTNVLFIDKENSPRRKKARIAGLNLRDGLENIHWVKFPHFFELADPKEEDGLSRFAKMLSKQVEKLDIGLIILDSFADVMVGNENAASDVQQFFDAIRKLFPNKSILVLHHENKPSQGVSRTSSQRVRGSTNITAQIVSGFRVFAIPKTTNEFVLEQFKAGDAEKLKPFKVQLVSKQNPAHPEKTYVSEVKHNGEYYDQEGQAELAEEQINDYLTENVVASRQDVIENCVSNGVSQRTVVSVLATMSDEGKIEKTRVGHKVNFSLK